MIIIEGPDGAGKTTLARQLGEEFPQLAEGTRGTKDRDELWKVTREDTYKALRHALTPGVTPLVWDRLFWSEFVYHSVMGRPCQFSGLDKSVILGVIAELHAPVIMCLPPEDVARKNINESKQMGGVKEDFEFIYESYESMVHEGQYFLPGINLLRYDYTAEDAREAKYRIFMSVACWLREWWIPEPPRS